MNRYKKIYSYHSKEYIRRTRVPSIDWKYNLCQTTFDYDIDETFFTLRIPTPIIYGTSEEEKDKLCMLILDTLRDAEYLLPDFYSNALETYVESRTVTLKTGELSRIDEKTHRRVLRSFASDVIDRVIEKRREENEDE